jgi:hypothetical protein
MIYVANITETLWKTVTIIADSEADAIERIHNGLANDKISGAYDQFDTTVEVIEEL